MKKIIRFRGIEGNSSPGQRGLASRVRGWVTREQGLISFK